MDEISREGTVEKKTTRRGFLDYAIGVGAAGLFGSVAVQVIKYLTPPVKAADSSAEVKAAGVNELAVGAAKKFDMNGKPAILIHMPSGYFALSAACTHLGCIVTWDSSKKMIVCPCHNGTFDYKGNIVSGPPPKPLPAYTVAVKGDGIMVSGGA